MRMETSTFPAVQNGPKFIAAVRPVTPPCLKEQAGLWRLHVITWLLMARTYRSWHVMAQQYTMWDDMSCRHDTTRPDTTWRRQAEMPLQVWYESHELGPSLCKVGSAQKKTQLLWEVPVYLNLIFSKPTFILDSDVNHLNLDEPNILLQACLWSCHLPQNKCKCKANVGDIVLLYQVIHGYQNRN